MVELPPENYSYIPADVQLPGTKWLDNHRSVFTVHIDAVTSVHTLNAYLDRFINLCEYLESRKIPPRIGESNIEREMKKALLDIEKSELEPLVKNLVLILDKLIELLSTMYKIGNQCLGLGPTVFQTLCLVSNKLAVSGCDLISDSCLVITHHHYFTDSPRGRYNRSTRSSKSIEHICSVPMQNSTPSHNQ